MTRLRRLERTDCTITIDSAEHPARIGETVAAAVLASGVELRLWCGMGSCHACLVEIDGQAGRRSCVEEVVPGMVVRSRGGEPSDA